VTYLCRNVSPQDLREEISDLRSDLSAYRSGQTSHSDRLGSIQQYLMTTSAILERQKIKDRQLSPKGFTMGRDDDQNSTVFSDSSTTAVSSPSTQSLIGLPERRLENVQTFKSFKDWLGSFAPPGQVSDTSEFQKNLEALRLAHPELHGGDKTTKQHESTQGKVPLAPKAAKAPKAKPTNVFNAKSFEMSNRLGSGLLDKSNQIRLFIQGISKPGSTEELTEEVTIRPDAQVYEVLEELYNRGTYSVHHKYSLLMSQATLISVVSYVKVLLLALSLPPRQRSLFLSPVGHRIIVFYRAFESTKTSRLYDFTIGFSSQIIMEHLVKPFRSKDS
jgi:hypothetical protein